MANKRIIDLNTAGILRGDERFVIDQLTPSCISGLDTVQTNLIDIQSFVLTNSPLISTTGNMRIEGDAYLERQLSVDGSITGNDITVNKNINTENGKILSAGIDLHDVFFTQLSGLGNLQQITDNGSTTTNSITSEGIITADGFNSMANDSRGYLSGGIPLTDIFLEIATGAGNLQQVTDAGSTTTNNLSVGNLSAKQIIGNSFTNTAPHTGSFIGGGISNTVNGEYSSIAGGVSNYIQSNSERSVIAGGAYNSIHNIDSVIGGGKSNTVNLTGSTIAGGICNTTLSAYAFIGGGYCNITSGEDAVIAGGRKNTAYGIGATVGGGHYNTVSDSYSVVGGGRNNLISCNNSAILGGQVNTIDSCNSVIAGGYKNCICDNTLASSVLGGCCNTVDAGDSSTVVSGYCNNVNGNHSFIVGGRNNAVVGDRSGIIGGEGNIVNNVDDAFIIGKGLEATISCTTFVNNLSAQGIIGGAELYDNGNRVCTTAEADTLQSVTDRGFTTTNSLSVASLTANGKIIGGINNTANGNNAAVVGGINNTASGSCSIVVGGFGNAASGNCSFVGGGKENTASGLNSVVGGGQFNAACGSDSFVGGGTGNRASGGNSIVGGGFGNTASSNYSFVGGGLGNTASGNSSIVGGGYNEASGDTSSVGGGLCNTASGNYAAVVGGHNNTAFGDYSSVAGGFYNTASGDCSFIAGGASNTVQVAHNNSFIIGSNITSNAACTTFVNNLDVEGTIITDTLSATGNITTESSFISAGTDLFSIMTTTSSVTADVEIGGIDKLDVISPGTTIQDLTERLLLRTYYPTFVLPSVSLTDDISTNVEVGTLGFTLIANFNAGAINGKIDNFIWDPNLKQDDRAGAATQYTFTGATIPTTSQAGNTLAFPSVTIIENANTFNVVTNYAIGPQPKDSRGNNYDSPLPAGSVTSNLTFYGRRNAFYGVDLTSNNSAGVRALTNTKLNPVNGTTFTINIPAGATDVAFAYPDGLRNVNSVIYVEGLNAEVKGAFSQQIVNVDGANGYTGIDYKLYTFTPANPFAETATYIVTI